MRDNTQNYFDYKIQMTKLLEVEVNIENLKKHKAPGVDHIPSK